MKAVTGPQRFRRSRQTAGSIPSGAVYVGRPGRWGNPFRPAHDGIIGVHGMQGWTVERLHHGNVESMADAVGTGLSHGYALQRAVDLFRTALTQPTAALHIDGPLASDALPHPGTASQAGLWTGDYRCRILTVRDVWMHLYGKDLVCWCLLNSPCHGDVLLEHANIPF